MNKTGYTEVWNLDKLFSFGHNSRQFHDHIQQLEGKVSKLEEKLKAFNKISNINESSKVESIIQQIADIQINLSQANSYVTCLLAQNPKDQNAMNLRAVTFSTNARFESPLKRFQRIILNTSHQLWEDIIETDELNRYKFILDEWRKKAEILLSEEEERLVSDLMVDGYHAWGQLYHSLLGSIKVKLKINGESKELSVGQTINLRSHPNEDIRKTAHYEMEEIWKENEELFSQILNHIAGFRLEVYKHRGIDNVLREPLIENRLKEETLNAMWVVVSKYKKPFIHYLNEKAKMNGDKKMQSYNFWAPIGKSKQKIEYEDAVNFILEHFSHFGSELENFARQAFDSEWIEAEDRPNKSTVAFCAGFPVSGESRVFMTYGKRMTSVLTLAHELGHAFHNYSMKHVNGINRQYPLSIAETASTFSEQIILDAAIEKTDATEEKLFLLDEKLKRSVMNFMNIHSRFLFEKNFYEERKQGFVSPSRLNELMQDAIDEAYVGSFENASSHSWVWTPHYYLTRSPFYNFQYTFGYLFSLSLYAKSKEKGKAFEREYLELLRDSGSMSTEVLVLKHLGEDITCEDFWEKGIKLCVKDVEQFINLISS
ncbi:pepF/M3 family oligoendopeptidase [Lederbergia galactosidilyticus]|uniref:M3 family oligoendopeptidase n=1 Tax=Lederbergia galactosidilytica TaxID=217031 RepID=UPI001AE2BC6E|nr:M3 family oligoendopeptidase [Lederbergia galactosidilytica]MBP1916340.1 pepF/M3 family oligoendopeptidase [Lederbergia galactosidilytica]